MKIIGILLIVGLIVPTTCAGAGIQNKGTTNTLSSQDERLDQFSRLGFDSLWLWGENTMTAQAFRPKLPTLSRIELGLTSYSNSANGTFIVSIRDSLDGQDLTAKNVSMKEVHAHTVGWVSIDFQDIQVTPNKRYFIVVTYDYYHYLEWCTARWNPYHRGMPWAYTTYPEPSWDLAYGIKFPDLSFRTYGIPG